MMQEITSEQDCLAHVLQDNQTRTVLNPNAEEFRNSSMSPAPKRPRDLQESTNVDIFENLMKEQYDEHATLTQEVNDMFSKINEKLQLNRERFEKRITELQIETENKILKEQERKNREKEEE